MAAATDWAKAHLRELAIGGGVLAVVVAAVAGYSSYARGESERAARALSDAVGIATADIGEPEEDAEPDPTVRMFKTHKQRAQAALRAFRRAVADFPSSEIAARAKLGEANALYDLRKLGEAERAYEAALALASDDTDVAAQALQGLAFCLEARNKPADALRRYEELARLGEAYRSMAEYHQARLHIDAGRRDRALTLLKGIRTRLTRQTPREREGDEEDNQPSPAERHPFLMSQVQSRLEQLDPTEATNAPAGGGAGMGGSPEEIIRRLQQMGGMGNNVKILGGGGRPAPTKR